MKKLGSKKGFGINDVEEEEEYQDTEMIVEDADFI
jgi:hypothetical protein